MGVSYSKLFKLLIDKKMKKKDLILVAGKTLVPPWPYGRERREEFS